MLLETITYKNVDINIHYDECASNPFEDFDGEPDLIALHDNNF
jgi:hypothetical protein